MVAGAVRESLPSRWNLAIATSLRSATVAGSTGIEGNPLTVEQVANVLTGGRAGDRESELEVLNYNAAMDIATRFAHQPEFVPDETMVRVINARVTSGTALDTLGLYRSGPVTVSGFYSGPHHRAVPGLMSALVAWWRSSRDHPLIRSALLHVNLAAIHPWDDGNGRTARILSSLVMMRTDLTNPEAINLESYFRANHDAYFDHLAATLGASYQPDRHSATEWVDYYVRASLLLLIDANRVIEGVREDINRIVVALSEAGRPTDWAPLVIAATLSPIQTDAVARLRARSIAATRRTLADMVDAGWLRREGRTRGTRYLAGPRTPSGLRTPALLGALSRGTHLPLEDSSAQWSNASAVDEFDGSFRRSSPSETSGGGRTAG